MKFIIHTLSLVDKAIKLEELLGEKCYIPGRDTNQEVFGDEILRQNYEGMSASDNDVWAVWDGKSHGSLFDMGMAYAMGKQIHYYRVESNLHGAWSEFAWEKYRSNRAIGRNGDR